jgi:hypothetical protein
MLKKIQDNYLIRAKAGNRIRSAFSIYEITLILFGLNFNPNPTHYFILLHFYSSPLSYTLSLPQPPTPHHTAQKKKKIKNTHKTHTRAHSLENSLFM